MSYSFNVKGATKEDAIKAATDRFAEVLAQQPSHVADLPHAIAATVALTQQLMDDTTCDVCITCSGSVWSSSDGIRQVAFSMNAGFNSPRT